MSLPLSLHRLICDAKVRLGRNGIKDFQNHPFFVGMDWDNIRKTKPPFIPEYSSPTDTRNFDPIEEEDDGMPRGHYVSVMCMSCDLFCRLLMKPFVMFWYVAFLVNIVCALGFVPIAVLISHLYFHWIAHKV